MEGLDSIYTDSVPRQVEYGSLCRVSVISYAVFTAKRASNMRLDIHRFWKKWVIYMGTSHTAVIRVTLKACVCIGREEDSIPLADDDPSALLEESLVDFLHEDINKVK